MVDLKKEKNNMSDKQVKKVKCIAKKSSVYILFIIK